MYHVRTHAVEGSWLFHADDDYRFRLAQVAAEVERRSIRPHAFCLMGNHEHWLLSVDEDDVLAKTMQRVNRRYAGTFNHKYGRRGRLYWRPYDSTPVLSNRYLIELIQYFALNPERDDFGRAETYRWSSYAALIGLVQPLWFIDQRPLLDAIGGGPDARRRIIRLVDGRRPFKRDA
jgi:putative transposase